jgi:hypothetical protein
MATIQPLDIIIVEKNASLKLLCVKDFKEEELYKKCGFKKADDFTKQTEWTVKMDGNKYLIQVYAKSEGRANNENKYDFPPPIDTKLFFGNCAIIAKTETSEKNYQHVNISLYLWNKIYEKLFGGFEDLLATAEEDEDEIDELKNVPKEKKTKNGYLKDGFVVDSDDDENDDDDDDDDDDEDDEDDEDEDDNDGDDISELNLEDCGSELSEEEYDYSLEEDSEEEK